MKYTVTMEVFSEIFREWNKISSDESKQNQARIYRCQLCVKEKYFSRKIFHCMKTYNEFFGRMKYWQKFGEADRSEDLQVFKCSFLAHDSPNNMISQLSNNLIHNLNSLCINYMNDSGVTGFGRETVHFY